MKIPYRILCYCACALLLLTWGPAAHAGIARHVRVTAYHTRKQTSGGSRPHVGTCAAPARWHGCYIQIPGVGWRLVTDTCRHGVDIWMPNAKACKRWGHRVLTVRVKASRHRK